MIIFGTRSPLVVDYEVAAERSGLVVDYGVSLGGNPRTLTDLTIVKLQDLDDQVSGYVVPCAFSPKRRKELSLIAQELGFDLRESLIDPTAILPPRVRIGRGGFVNAGVVAGAACYFGEGILLNRSASIGHHTMLSDYVSIGPGAVLLGGVQVGSGSMIGAGVVIQTGVKIGENVFISAGSVVRKNVPDGVLFSGNPGKVMPLKGSRSSIDGFGLE